MAPDSDSEDDLENAVQRTTKPTCNTESTAIKKRKRLQLWESTPENVVADLRNAKENVEKAHKEYKELDFEEEKWLLNFESARLKLCTAINMCKEENLRLKQDSKLMYDEFLRSFNKSISASRTRRNLQMKDIYEEFEECNNTQNFRIQEYEKLVAESGSLGKINSVNKSVLPIVTISIDELDYKYDKIYPTGKKSDVTNDINLNNKLPSTATGSEGSDCFSSISKLIYAIDESVKLSEAGINDIETFFVCDDQVEVTYADVGSNAHSDTVSSNLSKKQKVVAIPNTKSSSLVSSSLSCNDEVCLTIKDESEWVDHLENTVLQLNSTGKRRRRISQSSVVSISAFCYHRTPRDVRLLVSPLSQFEDKYLGTIHGGDIDYYSKEVSVVQHKPKIPCPLPIQVPYEIICEENSVIQRCDLQSSAAAVDTKVRRLRNAITDWKKIALESSENNNKIKLLHLNAVDDDYNESLKMRKELIRFGIIPSIDIDADGTEIVILPVKSE